MGKTFLEVGKKNLFMSYSTKPEETGSASLSSTEFIANGGAVKLEGVQHYEDDEDNREVDVLINRLIICGEDIDILHINYKLCVKVFWEQRQKLFVVTPRKTGTYITIDGERVNIEMMELDQIKYVCSYVCSYVWGGTHNNGNFRYGIHTKEVVKEGLSIWDHMWIDCICHLSTNFIESVLSLMKTLYKVKEVVVPQALEHNGTSQDKWNEDLQADTDNPMYRVCGKRHHLEFVIEMLARGWIFQEQMLYGPKDVSMYSAEYVAALATKKYGYISPDSGHVHLIEGPDGLASWARVVERAQSPLSVNDANNRIACIYAAYGAKFSFPEDALPAVVQHIVGCEYTNSPAVASELRKYIIETIRLYLQINHPVQYWWILSLNNENSRVLGMSNPLGLWKSIEPYQPHVEWDWEVNFTAMLQIEVGRGGYPSTLGTGTEDDASEMVTWENEDEMLSMLRGADELMDCLGNVPF